MTICKVYYNPRLNLIGLSFGLAILKIEEKSNYYMVLTKEWVEIGGL